MKTVTIHLILSILVIFWGGCSLQTSLPNEETPQLPKISPPPYLACAIAIDVSSSGKTYQVPPFKVENDLHDLMQHIIERGAGQIALTQVSLFSDVPAAFFKIPEGLKPSPLIEPTLDKFRSQQEYYLARQVYEKETLPAYKAAQAKYAEYCQQQVTHFINDSKRLFSNINSSESDLHSALNRLSIANNSITTSCVEYVTIIYGDGISYTTHSSPLTADTTTIGTCYWIHGTTNANNIKNQMWVRSYHPKPIVDLPSALTLVYQTTQNPCHEN